MSCGVEERSVIGRSVAVWAAAARVPPPPKSVQLWWLTHDGVTTPDPVPEARIIDLIRGGMDPVAALVCAVGSDQWRPASEAIPAARSVIPF